MTFRFEQYRNCDTVRNLNWTQDWMTIIVSTWSEVKGQSPLYHSPPSGSWHVWNVWANGLIFLHECVTHGASGWGGMILRAGGWACDMGGVVLEWCWLQCPSGWVWGSKETLCLCNQQCMGPSQGDCHCKDEIVKITTSWFQILFV